MNYIDSENYEEEIKAAIESAVASFNVDGLYISDEEKEKLTNKLINNENVKMLLKKKRWDNNGRKME